jgi:hypothetical protein
MVNLRQKDMRELRWWALGFGG